MLLIPVFTLIAFALALGVGLGLAAVNVRYRDISYLISFMLQLWMYASPIVYSGSMVPEKWRALYQLNPMVGVIQGFRWAILGHSGELGVPLLPSVIITALTLLASLLYFRAVERSFADVI
jgi:lipopolysaccharide transport system permease protein